MGIWTILSFGIYPWHLTKNVDGGGPFQGVTYLIHHLLYIICRKYARRTCNIELLFVNPLDIFPKLNTEFKKEIKWTSVQQS
jgi:hypothetical protein